jgi:hypothetical protein
LPKNWLPKHWILLKAKVASPPDSCAPLTLGSAVEPVSNVMLLAPPENCHTAIEIACDQTGTDVSKSRKTNKNIDLLKWETIFINCPPYCAASQQNFRIASTKMVNTPEEET